uniref:Fgenesh protein 126 n=1 Tax=Beta vulgaris TaxID=161934 RepID=Q20CC0_BETVU|nr:Fgenesh protein 126 [Beta vulgaris]
MESATGVKGGEVLRWGEGSLGACRLCQQWVGVWWRWSGAVRRERGKQSRGRGVVRESRRGVRGGNWELFQGRMRKMVVYGGGYGEREEEGEVGWWLWRMG